MKKCIKDCGALPLFVKAELITLVINVVCGALFAVIIGKAQGLTFAGSMIGVLVLTQRSIKLLSLAVKPLALGTKYLTALWIAAVEVVWLLAFDAVPTALWCITMVVLAAVQGLFISAFYNDYDSVIVKLLSISGSRDLRYVETMVLTSAGIAGGILGILVATATMSSDPLSLSGIGTATACVAAVMAGGTILSYHQYVKYYRHIDMSVVLDDTVTVSSIDDLI